jgi:hypothetical protein
MDVHIKMPEFDFGDVPTMGLRFFWPRSRQGATPFILWAVADPCIDWGFPSPCQEFRSSMTMGLFRIVPGRMGDCVGGLGEPADTEGEDVVGGLGSVLAKGEAEAGFCGPSAGFVEKAEGEIGAGVAVVGEIVEAFEHGVPCA